jgi:hypothetical protein
VVGVLKMERRTGYASPSDGGNEPAELFIGADPEWEEYDPATGRIIYPSGTRFDADEGSVGVDGAGTVVEARPRPDSDPDILYGRIVHLARQWESRSGHRVCLAGHRYAAGCHLHIGAGYPAYRIVGDFYAYVCEVDRRIGRLVHLSGGARGGYARRREWRPQPWGLEYRTLPSAVLADRAVAVWAMGVALALAAGRRPPYYRRHVRAAVDRIAEAVVSGHPFTFGPEPLPIRAEEPTPEDMPAPEPEPPERPCIILAAEDYWHDAWRAWAAALEQHGRVLRPIRLFGLRRARGLITTSSVVAEAFDWRHLEEERPRTWTIGLPYAVRIQPATSDFQRLEHVLISAGFLRPGPGEEGESSV